MAVPKVPPPSAVDQLAEVLDSPEIAALVSELEATRWTGRPGYPLRSMVGVALGPAVGGALLGTSPGAIWWGGAVALALTGAGFLRLGNRIPDPLMPAKSPPLAASEAT